ncbi:MAG: O-antigen ligase family protein [Patescibacteria group bacterium]
MNLYTKHIKTLLPYLDKVLLHVFIAIIPLNLSYHFKTSWVYFSGTLVDYLIPVITLQDIAAVLFVFYYIIKTKKFFISKYLGFGFALTILISYFVSILPLLSVYWMLRILLYICLFSTILDCLRNNSIMLSNIVTILFVSGILVVFLSLLQFYLKGSVFNNYIILGEQPYSLSTPHIVKESVYGFTYVPPYGLFKHPNVLGGYASFISLVGVVLLLKSRKVKFVVILLATLLALLVLFLTFSYVAWVSFIIGIVLFVIPQLFPKISPRLLFLYLITLLVVVFVSLYTFSNIIGSDSVVRRTALLSNYIYNVSTDRFFLGYGLGTSSVALYEQLPYIGFKTPQPVHNIFFLMLSDVGILGLFVVLVGLYKLITNINNAFSLSFLSIFMIMGFFDHYLVTSIQFNYLFLLTVCLSFAYNHYEDLY